MKERHSYIGTLNGVKGVWCDQKPDGIQLEKDVTWYSPDEGKVFTKDGELFDSVIITDGVDISEYIEIVKPEEKQE